MQTMSTQRLYFVISKTSQLWHVMENVIDKKHQMKSKLILAIAFFSALQLAKAQHHNTNKTAKWTSGRPDGHAPIGVMGDHAHQQGDWMFSYRSMVMQMEGNLSESDKISNGDIYSKYMVAPQEMRMNMRMFGVMYAPSDRITLMVMTKYLDNKMEMLTTNSMMAMMRNVKFETASTGLGDTKVGALYTLYNKNRRAMHVNIGLSIPSGNLIETGSTPMSDPNEIRLGYTMQLGSGTWDPSLGVTCLKQYDVMSYGAQTTYLYRVGENEEGYTLGNKWNATFWTARNFSKTVSVSARAEFNAISSIKGADKTFTDPMNSPVFDAANSGKIQLDILFGINYGFFKGAFKGMRLEVEAGVPVYQYVQGVQMNQTLVMTAGIQYSLGH
jgi:hypothetical protein